MASRTHLYYANEKESTLAASYARSIINFANGTIAPVRFLTRRRMISSPLGIWMARASCSIIITLIATSGKVLDMLTCGNH